MGTACGDVGEDLVEGTALGGGEVERERLKVALEAAAEVERGGVLVVLPDGASLEHGHLDGEELAEGEAFAGAFGILECLGRVVGADTVGEGRQSLLFGQPRRHGIGEAFGELFDSIADGAADGALPEALGTGVDGQQAPGAHDARVEGLVLGGVRHLQATAVDGDGAGDRQLLAFLDAPMHPRHVEPDDAERTGTVVDDGLAAPDATAVAHLAGGENRAHDRLGQAVGLDLGDAANVGEVAQAAGEEEGGIGCGGHAELLEALGGALADTGQAGDRVVETQGALAGACGQSLRGRVGVPIGAGGGDGAFEPVPPSLGVEGAVATAPLQSPDALVEGVAAADRGLIHDADKERIEATGYLGVGDARIDLAPEEVAETGQLGVSERWRSAGGQPYGLRRTAQMPSAFGPR